MTDPGNLGAIIRSVEVAGGSAVIIPKDRSASIGPVVHKASAGATAHLPVVRVPKSYRPSACWSTPACGYAVPMSAPKPTSGCAPGGAARPRSRRGGGRPLAARARAVRLPGLHPGSRPGHLAQRCAGRERARIRVGPTRLMGRHRLIIDGYNVLHAHPEYGSLAREDIDSARARLVSDLTALVSADEHVTVVFDGGGNPHSDGLPHHIGRLTVVFSPAGQLPTP